MEIITHPTSMYSQDYIYDKCMVGRPEELRPTNRGLDNLRQIYSGDPAAKKAKRKEALKKFKNRPGREPWPWETEDA